MFENQRRSIIVSVIVLVNRFFYFFSDYWLGNISLKYSKR